ncbi:metallophosphoesterase [Litoreibacter roseus]|uniref:Metallophosphoesterase n=1 Tax=Litoreibacter roseus TaxID=2601869 RepID=A0A6N6JEJ0_9RHOB|nr:metallophosphoesterase [Litoreibacter roseus]GFE64377.1 metallophosphoesterase [Litoreibacter roseus]
MIYAIGDIHGQAAQLDNALGLIEADGGPDAPIVFLGDYTDRGPDSNGVLERLIDGQAEGRPWTFIKGNHDRMFVRFLTQGWENDDRISSGLSWLNPRMGGLMTLASYGVGDGTGAAFLKDRQKVEKLSSVTIDGTPHSMQELVSKARNSVPESHIQFLDTRPLVHQHGDLTFVHAGIRPGIPLTDQDEDDLVWIRKEFIEDDRDHGTLIIHGHTALDHPVNYGNRVNLDGGAGYGRPLIPAVFEGRDCWLLTEPGRLALNPCG